LFGEGEIDLSDLHLDDKAQEESHRLSVKKTLFNAKEAT
jgi:hypothetical protein